MALLLTRPMNDAREEAQILSHQGYPCILSPVSKIEPVSKAAFEKNFPVLKDYSASIFTSANAVHAVQSLLCADTPLFHQPCYCVGSKTAQAARNAGFQIVCEGQGTVDSLIHLIEDQKDGQPAQNWVYFSGDIIRHDPRPRLQKLAIHLDRYIVYHAKTIPDLSPEAKTALRAGEIEVVLFYSPRAVDIFVDQLKKSGLSNSIQTLHILCLSAEIVDKAAQYGFQSPRWATHQNMSAMHEALKSMLKDGEISHMPDRPASLDKPEKKTRPIVLFLAGIIVLLAAFIAGLLSMPWLAPRLAPYIAWFETTSPRDYSAEIQKLEQAIAALSTSALNASAPSDIVDYTPRLDALEKRIELLGNMHNPARLQDVEAKLYDLESDLKQLNARQDTPAPDPLPSARLDALEDRVAQISAASDITVRPALETLAFATLKDQVTSGVNYEESLNAFDAYTTTAAAQNATAQLRLYAANGVANSVQLQTRFTALSSAILRAAYTDQNANWWNRLLGQGRNLITIRKTGDNAGDTPDILVSRAETRLIAQDWRGARATLQRLPEHVVKGDLLGEFLAALDAHITATEALNTLQNTLDRQS